MTGTSPARVVLSVTSLTTIYRDGSPSDVATQCLAEGDIAAPQLTATTGPGRPWQEGLDSNHDFQEYITHIYEQSTNGGTLPVHVSTNWSAEFRVNGEATWTSIDEIIQVRGINKYLEVREARAYLTLPDD
jgi:hypothetical protein